MESMQEAIERIAKDKKDGIVVPSDLIWDVYFKYDNTLTALDQIFRRKKRQEEIIALQELIDDRLNERINEFISTRFKGVVHEQVKQYLSQKKIIGIKTNTALTARVDAMNGIIR